MKVEGTNCPNLSGWFNFAFFTSSSSSSLKTPFLLLRNISVFESCSYSSTPTTHLWTHDPLTPVVARWVTSALCASSEYVPFQLWSIWTNHPDQSLISALSQELRQVERSEQLGMRSLYSVPGLFDTSSHSAWRLTCWPRYSFHCPLWRKQHSWYTGSHHRTPRHPIRAGFLWGRVHPAIQGWPEHASWTMANQL